MRLLFAIVVAGGTGILGRYVTARTLAHHDPKMISTLCRDRMMQSACAKVSCQNPWVRPLSGDGRGRGGSIRAVRRVEAVMPAGLANEATLPVIRV